MTLAELITSVYSVTNRPDLVGQTLLEIQQATLKCHQKDFFYKDLFETGVDLGSEAYIQQLQYQTLLPRWRALKYIRKTDVNLNNGPFLDIILPETALDDFGYERTNCVYGAGAVLQVKSNTLLRYIILGAYLNPDITESGYTSWIAVDHPFTIINHAAAAIFKQIGDTDQFAAYTRMSMESLQDVINSNIIINGY